MTKFEIAQDALRNAKRLEQECYRALKLAQQAEREAGLQHLRAKETLKSATELLALVEASQ